MPGAGLAVDGQRHALHRQRRIRAFHVQQRAGLEIGHARILGRVRELQHVFMAVARPQPKIAVALAGQPARLGSYAEMAPRGCAASSSPMSGEATASTSWASS